MTQVTITRPINVFDPQALYDAAVASYVGDGFNAEGIEYTLGSRDAPNLEACLIEIWASRTPVESGYEFM